MTTVFDAAGEGSAKACWVLMRRAKRTSLSPQVPPCVSQDQKTGHVLVRTSGAEWPVISVVEIGYVRRSEFMIRSAPSRSTFMVRLERGRVFKVYYNFSRSVRKSE